MTVSSPLPHHDVRIWLVVGDGGQAHIYRRIPGSHIVVTPQGPREDLTWDLEPVALPSSHARDLELARDIAHALNRARAEHQFDGVVIVAPPHWLGQLRPYLNADVTKAVLMEVRRDLAHLSPSSLARRMEQEWPARHLSCSEIETE